VNSVSFVVYGVNLVMIGDAETGPCMTVTAVTHPTLWSYNGSFPRYPTVIRNGWQLYRIRHRVQGTTEAVFSEPRFNAFSFSNDRGNCYFIGFIDNVTSMSQTVDLNPYASAIDNANVSFNMSAWLGG
jgi:hypothetical protein